MIFVCNYFLQSIITHIATVILIGFKKNLPLNNTLPKYEKLNLISSGCYGIIVYFLQNKTSACTATTDR